jgi:hypothetical protein
MSKPRKKKRPPKRVLALPDLEHAKAAVLNSLTSKSGQRTMLDGGMRTGPSRAQGRLARHEGGGGGLRF